MGKPTKTTAPTSPDYERGHAMGIMDAVRVASHQGKLCMDGEEMRAIAEALGVPVLFIETAQTYDTEDLDKLTDWWAARRAVV